MANNDWKNTKLWIELNTNPTRLQREPETEQIISILSLLMPKISKILNSSNTTPTDFTLHDSDHSFRVAEWIYKICPKDVFSNLSSYEISILLLSAYLHDIGMSPNQKRVTTLYNYIISGKTNKLLSEEIDSFQNWLDNEDSNDSSPNSTDKPFTIDYTIASELVGKYCRFKHNDWSESWILDNLNSLSNNTYNNFIDDLIMICKSHHYGYEDLVSSDFDARPVSQNSNIINFRYLACLLRIADVLDIDPERTPDVIFRNRDICPSSIIFWKKDHEISIDIDQGIVVISGHPTNARIHKALEETANQIESELRNCQKISIEKPFDRINNYPTLKLPHHWGLAASAQVQITPRPNTYTYINATFRPSTERLLTLLSGLNLYRSELAAIRELLQNAFDAVKEQIALERLAKPNPKDKDLGILLSKIHSVDLYLNRTENGSIWLECRDDGIGMSKEIIENYLLVSGTKTRSDIINLSKRCNKYGFGLERSGEFGIGVLSYFMVSDVIQIETLRSQYARDSEPIGWQFFTEGIGTFGELKKKEIVSQGTVVKLCLNKTTEKIDQWVISLCKFIKDELVYIPCNFRFHSNIESIKEINLNAGWCSNTRNITTDSLINKIFEEENDTRYLEDYLEQDSILIREEIHNKQEAVLSNINACFEWKTITSGDLPNSLGRYEIKLPIFNIDGGLSNFYLQTMYDKKIIITDLDGFTGVHAFYPSLGIQLSWRGMRVGSRNYDYFPRTTERVLINIDWTSSKAGKISINRDTISLTKEALDTFVWVDNEFSSSLHKFIIENITSPYIDLTYSMFGKIIKQKTNPHWLKFGDNKSCVIWDSMDYPFVFGDELATLLDQGNQFHLLWREEKVDIALPMIISAFERYRDERLTLDYINPDRIAFINEDRFFRFVGLTTTDNNYCQKIEPRKDLESICSFPRDWEEFWFIQNKGRYVSKEKGKSSESRTRVYFNKDHELTFALSQEDNELITHFEEISQQFSLIETLKNIDKILTNEHTSRLWLRWVLSSILDKKYSEMKIIWNGLLFQFHDFFIDLWSKVFSIKAEDCNKKRIICIYQSDYSHDLITFSLDGFKREEVYHQMSKLISIPNDEWRIKVSNKEIA